MNRPAGKHPTGRPTPERAAGRGRAGNAALESQQLLAASRDLIETSQDLIERSRRLLERRIAR